MSEQKSIERMEPGLNDLRRQLSSKNVYDVLSARRAGPNELDRIMHLVPYPKDIDVQNPLPEWKRLPLCSKIPSVQAPKDFVVVTRGKLGETVRRQGDTFDLSDPFNYNLQINYDPIHDKHLRHYFFSPGNKKILDDMGILTKDNAVKCDLKEYNAYRRYVYNVHKNSVLNALRETEEINLDKGIARKFLENALETRQLQFRKEDIEKQALRRAAQRRLISICEKLLCDLRKKRFDLIQEKKAKQKEREGIRLLISQKKFQESLENYRMKSHDVAWKRNIRAQKKWRKVCETDAQRKSINADIDRISKLLEVIESWIKKDVQQIAARERDLKIWKAYRNYSTQRKSAREKNFKQIHLKNIGRLEEIKKHGPTPKEVLEKRKLCNHVGDTLAGFKKMKPDMNQPKPVTSIVRQTLNAAIESGDRKSKLYFGTNLMSSRMTSGIANNILGCIYRRALTMYVKNAVYRYLPILITELKHVIVMFEEDMNRKKFSVDEIRRMVQSFVGGTKGSMFEPPNDLTSCGFIGKLKDGIYRTTKRCLCKCDSKTDTKSDSSDRRVTFDKKPTSMIKEQPKEKRVSFTVASQSKDKVVESVGSLTKNRDSGDKNKVPSGKSGEGKGKSKRAAKTSILSILKKCPMRRALASESNPSLTKDKDVCCLVPLSDVCKCNKGVCECLKEVNRVKFTVPDSSAEVSVKSEGSDKEVTRGKRVSFLEKTTTIEVSQEDWLAWPYDDKLYKHLDLVFSTMKSKNRAKKKTSGQESQEHPSVMFSKTKVEKLGSPSKEETSVLRVISISEEDGKLLSPAKVESSNLIIKTKDLEHQKSLNTQCSSKLKPVTKPSKKKQLTAENIHELISKKPEEGQKHTSSHKIDGSATSSLSSLCSMSSSDIREEESSYPNSKEQEKSGLKLPKENNLNELDGSGSYNRNRTGDNKIEGMQNLNIFERPPTSHIKPLKIKLPLNEKGENFKSPSTRNEGNTVLDSGGQRNGYNDYFKVSPYDEIILNERDRKFFQIQPNLSINSNIRSNHDKLVQFNAFNPSETEKRMYGHKQGAYCKDHYYLTTREAGMGKNLKGINVEESGDYLICQRPPLQRKKQRGKTILREYKPPVFPLSDSDLDKAAASFSKALQKQYIISEKKDNLQNDEPISSLIGDSIGDQNNLALESNLDEAEEMQNKASLPLNNLHAEAARVPNTYSTGNKPRGVILRQCSLLPLCDPRKSETINDNKVLCYFPKGSPEPRYGPLFNLQQVFEPSYKPVYSPDVVYGKQGQPDLKSILKRTSYRPADSCSLIPKYMSLYKFRSVSDLKDFVVLRNSLSACEALAASKIDKQYTKPSESDVTIHSTRTKTHRKKKVVINLDALKKYSYEIIPGSNETYKKVFSSSHSEVPSENFAPLLAPDIQDGYAVTDYSEEAFKEYISSPQSLGPSDNFVKYPATSSSVTKLVTEAIPEVSEVYLEFFRRRESSPQSQCNVTHTKQLKSSLKKKSDPHEERRGPGPRFRTPEDVIIASISITGKEAGGTRAFISGQRGSRKPDANIDPLRTESKSQNADEVANLPYLESENRTSDSSSSNSSSGSSTSSSDLSVPELNKFNLLYKGKSKAKETILCGICGVCTHSQAEGDQKLPDEVKDILKCSHCGRCIHELLRSSDNTRNTSDEGWLNTRNRKYKKVSEVASVKQTGDVDNDDEGIVFLNDDEVRKYYFNKRRDEVKTKADLRAVFGPDFNPNKFVYFVDKNNEYICWRDVTKRRYPLRPFPWNTTKRERLTKRKLPISDLKYYTYPKVIFQRKAAIGFENWEASRKEELEGGKPEMSWNSVPPKYAKLFSTTHKPANRPARKLKSIKSRRPTPMPSMTDLVTRTMEESMGDLREAKEKITLDKPIFSVMKTKIDSTTRIMMNIVTVICILKMKKGYPDIRQMISQKEKSYYYVPLKKDRYCVKKLVKGFSEFMICHEIKHMNYARLEPLADILLKYIIDPDNYPLLFPESADDILQDSDSTDGEEEPPLQDSGSFKISIND